MVFSPTWRTEMDAECAYRYAMTIADRDGGDPDQGTAGFGHSLGATAILIGGLDDATYGEGGTDDECFTGTPRPSVVVPISGCHDEYEGQGFPFEPVPYAEQDVEITDDGWVRAPDDPIGDQVVQIILDATEAGG